MSTKESLYYSDPIHVYKECYDDRTVYFKVNNEKIRVELEFSMEEFVKISSTVDLQSLKKQSEITDEQIRNYVKEKVKLRCGDCTLSIFGIGVYGSNSLPQETQIENGFSFYQKKRDFLKYMIGKIEEKFIQKISFGLEDIISDKTKE